MAKLYFISVRFDYDMWHIKNKRRIFKASLKIRNMVWLHVWWAEISWNNHFVVWAIHTAYFSYGYLRRLIDESTDYAVKLAVAQYIVPIDS